MSGLLYLVPLALALGFGGLVAFLWALRSGQFDDMDGAAGRILFDEPEDKAGSSSPSVPTRRSKLHD
jgi:cbb3-type cytochrome oxidase maturation protein